jgi:hypothetical protein
MEKRQQAMYWWHNLSNEEKNNLALNYYERNWFNLTGREIQKIYEAKQENRKVGEGIEDVNHL